jgi:PAS domain S-box-containing protein
MELSDALICALLQELPLPFAILSSEGKFLKMNHSYATLFGYEEAQLVARCLGDTVQGYTTMPQHNFPENWIARHATGREFMVHFKHSLIQFEGQAYHLLLVKDITEAKKYEQLFQSVARSLQVGGWELDLLTGENTWTEEVYNIYEVAHNFDVNVENGLHFYHPESQPLLQEALQKAIEQAQPFDLELRFISAKGTEKWVRSTCEPILLNEKVVKLVGSFQDISVEHKRLNALGELLAQEQHLNEELSIREEHLAAMQGELEESYEQLSLREERLRALIENGFEGVAILDALARVQYLSPSVLHIIGKSLEEIRAVYGFKAIHPKDFELVQETFLKIIQEPQQKHHLVVRFLSPKGAYIWVELIAQNFLDNKAINGIVVNWRDITERKLQEEQLQKSEALYRGLVEQSKDMILQVSIDQQVLFISPACKSMLGYSPEEFYENQALTQKILHPDSAQNFVYIWQFYQEQGFFPEENVELQWIHKNGATVTVQHSFKNLYDKNGKVIAFQAIGRDVSRLRQEEKRRKEAELHLLQAADRLNLAAQSVQLGVWDWDFAQEKLFWNDKMYELFGFDQKENANILQQSKEAIHPEDRLLVETEMQSRLSQQAPVDLVFRIIRADNGKVRYMQTSARLINNPLQQPVKVIGTMLDITERVEQAQEILRQKNLLQKLFDNLPVMVALFDAKGRFVLINKEWERLLGWTVEETLRKGGSLLREFYPDEAVFQEVLQFMQEAPPIWKDFRTCTKDGQTLDTSWTNLKLDDGYSISIGQDISQRKHSEREREALIKRLREFAFLTSHNLRRPLANILGLIELFGTYEEYNIPEEIQVIINSLLISARELDTVIWTMNLSLE